MWDEIVEVNRIVTEDIVSTVDGKDYTFSDMCTIWEGECLKNEILDLSDLMPEINNGSYKLSYPLMINPSTFSMYIFPFYFGGIELNEEDQSIESVKAITLFYAVQSTGGETNRR